MMRVTDICEVARSLRIIDLSEVMSGVNIAVAVIYPALSSPAPLPLSPGGYDQSETWR